MADTIQLTGADQQAVARAQAGKYHGFSLRETSGTARAVVEIFDGTSPAGELLDSISLAAGESTRESYAEGIGLNNGIYVDVVSGAVRGSVRVG